MESGVVIARRNAAVDYIVALPKDRLHEVTSRKKAQSEAAAANETAKDSLETRSKEVGLDPKAVIDALQDDIDHGFQIGRSGRSTSTGNPLPQ